MMYFFCFGKNTQLNNCFGWPFWCHLMQVNLLIWADSAGWTGWEVLLVLAEW